MRRNTILSLVAFAVAVVVTDESASAFPKTDKGRSIYVKHISHPDVALSSIVYHLTNTVLDADRPFIRYFWWGATPDDRLVHDITNWHVYLNKVNSQVRIVKPIPIAGTDFRLWAVDIRDLGWTVSAFAAVAHRDRVFTEPNVDHYLAEKTRRLVGIAQDAKFVHAEAVVPGPWFTWTVMNPGESGTDNYYDMLYANERFGVDVVGSNAAPVEIQTVIPPEPQKPQERPWPGGLWKNDGKEYPAGSFNYVPLAEMEKYEKDLELWKKAKESSVAKPKIVLPIGEVVKGVAKKNFPENLKEFQDRWGATANKQFLDSIKIFVDKGAVVAGSKSDGKRGSYVAFQDRVIRIGNSEFNHGGANMDTQDFGRTSGRSNPANLPVESSLGQLQEDAGENLYQLPNGFQAALIHGAAKDGRKRVDHADSKFVHASLDPRDVTIWDGYSSCAICHARNYGVLAPSNNKINEARARGVRLNFLNKADQLIVDSFFEVEEYRFEQIRMPFKRALEKATTITDAPPWNGTQFAEATISFIEWYNRPVDLFQASAEFGVPPIVVMIACLHLLGEDNKGNFDSKNLFLNWPIPRSVFDDDVFPEMSRVIALIRDIEKPSPLMQLFAPELLRQSAEKFGTLPIKPKKK